MSFLSFNAQTRSISEEELLEMAAQYVEEVSEFSLPAIKLACVRLRRGLVPGRSVDFAPAVPAFYQAVSQASSDLAVHEWNETHTFLECDTPEWRALLRVIAPRTPPETDRTLADGRRARGWWIPAADIERLPSALVEEERALLERREPDPMLMALVKRQADKLKRIADA